MSLLMLILAMPWLTDLAISSSGLPDPPCSTSGTETKASICSSRSSLISGFIQSG